MSSSRAATDTSHRVPYPNARPRRIKLVGVGETGRRVAAEIHGPDLTHVDIVPPSAGATTASLAHGGEADASAAMLRSIATSADQQAQALAGADMVFIVLGRGEDGREAGAISRIARNMRTLVTGVVIDNASEPSQVGERGLDELRQACDMLVITSEPEDLRAMLSSLGTMPPTA
jgi:cell division GTPase FtsZ